ncbi:hypothetical protein [Aeromicrobium sp.]|uniref:hypothetical protein n=1 Tax=Aeromicrobium sp. TaxID=1871063 RepID=UPI0030BBAD2C
MRIGSAVLLIWLIIGVLAAAQRDYFTSSGDADCSKVGDTVLTIAAGPLNYAGVNPKVDCETPEPSE